MFFGDMGGNFYALEASTGDKLWGQKIGGAIGGGVITYEFEGQQLVAVATGLTEVLWPSEQTTAKVSVLGVQAQIVRLPRGALFSPELSMGVDRSSDRGGADSPVKTE